MIRAISLAVLTLSAHAFAQSPRSLLTEADMVLQRAQTLAAGGFYGSGQCAVRMPTRIEMTRDALEDVLEDEDDRDQVSLRVQYKLVKRVRKHVEKTVGEATQARCNPQVAQLLTHAANRIEKAEDRLEDFRKNGWQWVEPAPVLLGRATLSPLTVYQQQAFEGAMSVRVDVPRVVVEGMQGRAVAFVAQARSVNGGRQGPVLRSQPVTVPASPYAWENAYAQFFKHQDLQLLDGGKKGRFIARIALVDERGAELGAQETSFEVQFGPGLPPGPPPGMPVVRDCGTGPDDAGCGVQRNGRWAMDAETFGGLMTTLKATSSEFTKKEMTENIVKGQALTAKQLGFVLDQFNSEFTKLEVAKLAVPVVVNPPAAIGLSVKFNSSFNRGEFVKLVTAQK